MISFNGRHCKQELILQGVRWYLAYALIGKWKYYYRAVDKQGETIDFPLTAKHDKRAALRFLRKAIGPCGKPSLIDIDEGKCQRQLYFCRPKALVL